MTVTDLSVLFMLLLNFYMGWRRGFLQSLLNPLSLILGIFLSFQYFQRTHNVLLSLAISVAAPLVIKFFGSIVIALWRKAESQEEEASLLSQWGGGLVCVIWSGGFMAILIFLLSLVPPNFPGLAVMHNDVVQSLSFTIISTPIKKRLPFIERLQKQPKGLTLTVPSPEATSLETTAAYQDLMKDERVKTLFSDEETLQQIREKDMAKLLNNPKVYAILQDKDLVGKFIELYGKMMEENAPSAAGTTPMSP